MTEKRGWLKRAFLVPAPQTRSAEDWAADVRPPARSAVSEVTVDRALSLAAVFRSVQIITTQVKQLELDVWRNGEKIPTPAVVSRPDINESLSQFLKRTTTGLALTGNAYWRVYRDPDKATVLNVQALNPLAVTITYDDKGRKQFHYSGDQFGVSKPQTFTTAQVKHLRLLEVPGHTYGLGPIQSARAALSGALDLRDFSANWFRDGGVPTGVLSSSDELTKEQSDAYLARWNEAQANRTTAVLGRSLTYEATILSPADAQFLESLQYTKTEIATLFGVPAAYLLAEVNGNSMTYQSLEMADTQFLRATLLDYLLEIEDALSDLLPRGQRAKFNVDGLLRPDAKTQAEVHKIYAELGAISLQEVRDQKGWTGAPPPAPQAKPKPIPQVEVVPHDA